MASEEVTERNITRNLAFSVTMKECKHVGGHSPRGSSMRGVSPLAAQDFLAIFIYFFTCFSISLLMGVSPFFAVENVKLIYEC